MTVFETTYRVILPIGLVLVMFGMGIGLELADFRRVLQFRRAALSGIAGQLIFLPFLAFGLSLILPMPPDIAIGLIIISACPGGVSSNALVYAARGDVALSVTLTAINSMVTVFSIPFVVSLGIAIHLGAAGVVPDMPILATIAQLFSVSVIPVGAGMVVRELWPSFAEKLSEPFRVGAVLVLVIIVVGAIGMQIDIVVSGLKYSGPYALLLNILAMLMGFGLAKLAQLDDRQKLTIAIEIGLQNGTLAVLVALTLLNMKEAAVLPSTYSALMLVTGAFFTMWLGRRLPQPSAEA